MQYDIIIVGGGHSGCEAAVAASKIGCSVLLITMKVTSIGQMSCNPAMGGVGKGQIVREIDAMGGMSGIIADKSMLQFRMLNKSKGPAMWSPRTQNDRAMFSQLWRNELEKNLAIDFWQDSVTELIIKNKKVCGVKTQLGLSISSKSVILTTGTFLGGAIRIGQNTFSSGRIGENSSLGLTKQLIDLGFCSSRLHTGTSPRVDGRSLDYSKMETQIGEENPEGFSFFNIVKPKKQLPCYITYTNPEVHDIIRNNIDKSPTYQIDNRVGPRYCPGILEKIIRFSEKDRHQIFVEPEGWLTSEVYVNGFSISLPYEIQLKAIRKIPGFENAKITQPGYDIAYDYFFATQLKRTLETKLIQNLYFAGQINGTTGYEEAACQGLVAGINASRKIKNLSPFIFSRTDSYIGVLVDDLTSKEIREPYRMFTSRAEFRLILRNDNADLRLSAKAYELGLISKERYDLVIEKKQKIDSIEHFFKEKTISVKIFNSEASLMDTAPLRDRSSLFSILQRPEMSIEKINKHFPEVKSFLNQMPNECISQAEIQMKYRFYIEREKILVDKVKKMENLKIPNSIDYKKIKALSSEAIEKLLKIKPETIGHAKMIDGVSASDLSILTLFIEKS